MCAQSDRIQNVLACIAEKLNIKKWRYEIQTIPGNIVNYIANIVPVALIDDSSDVTTHLVIKADSTALDKFEPIVKGAYKREVYLYTMLVPLFKNNIQIHDFFPECYYADCAKGNRVIVLQNMVVEGFRRYETGTFLDQEHLTLTLEALAKLHSFSLILKVKNIKPEYDHVMNPFCLAREPLYTNSLQKCFKKYGVDIFRDTQHEEYFKSLYDTMNSMSDFMDRCVKDARTLVYGHCDTWKENLLFKYSDSKPVKVCLLDYQMCHLISPAYDVLFLIMNSTDSTVRRKHYRAFLSTYYTTLEGSLRDNGIDIGKVYSEKDFHGDLKLIFPICFSVTVFSYALWLGLDDFTSLLDIADETITVNDAKRSGNRELFMKIIGNIITDFEEFGMTKTSLTTEMEILNTLQLL